MKTIIYLLFFTFSVLSVRASDPIYAVGPKALNMDEVAKTIDYPKATNRGGIEGTVMVYVEINDEGTVTNKTVLSSPCRQLISVVENAVDDLKFEPAKDEMGHPMASGVRIPFQFELEID